MTTQIADRLSVQEQEIRWLSDEIGRLLDLGTQGTVEEDPNPELVALRAENEKLKYRVAHLQKSLKEEQEKGGPEDSPGLEEEIRPKEEKGEVSLLGHNNFQWSLSHCIV